MFGQEKIEALTKRALKVSQAPATEVVVMADHNFLTRFASNAIHQNVNETNVEVYVRAVDGQRSGWANSTDLSDEGLERAAGRALAHARAVPADPAFPGLPDPQPVSSLPAVDEEALAFTPEERATAVGVVCKLAKERGLMAYGAYTTNLSEVGVGSSKGVMAYHASTLANLQTVVRGENGSGWAQRSGWQVGVIDGEDVAREAVERAVRAQNPRRIEHGVYTVILDTYAVLDILSQLNFVGFGADSVQEGRSWMNDRIGQPIMSDKVTIYDDGASPQGIPLPFDFQGTPRRKVFMAEAGTIGGPVYDHYTASKEGKQSTGHALPPNLPAFLRGPLGFNLFMQGGDSSVEDMIASTERGLYITRFWYTRTVHPRDCVITGMTRDGVMLIENGEIAAPVKDLRFTQSYVNALAAVEAVARETRLLWDDFAVRVPALKIREFTFTGVTM